MSKASGALIRGKRVFRLKWTKRREICTETKMGWRCAGVHDVRNVPSLLRTQETSDENECKTSIKGMHQIVGNLFFCCAFIPAYIDVERCMLSRSLGADDKGMTEQNGTKVKENKKIAIPFNWIFAIWSWCRLFCSCRLIGTCTLCYSNAVLHVRECVVSKISRIFVHSMHGKCTFIYFTLRNFEFRRDS